MSGENLEEKKGSRCPRKKLSEKASD